MAKDSLQEEAQKLMRLKGNIRGDPILSLAEYIKYRKGEEGVKQIEEKMKEWGYPLKFKEIKPLDWYPDSYKALVILAAVEVFNWKEPDIFEMGNSLPKYSLIVRLLMKTFLSIRKCFEESPNYWREHYDSGTLEPLELNEKEKYLRIRLKDYKFHPLVCQLHAGYFLRIGQYVLKSRKITIEETMCMHRGDPYHDFLIKWE